MLVIILHHVFPVVHNVIIAGAVESTVSHPVASPAIGSIVIIVAHGGSHSHSDSKPDHAGGEFIAMVVFVDNDRLSRWRRCSGVYRLWVVLRNIDHLGISGLN